MKDESQDKQQSGHSSDVVLLTAEYNALRAEILKRIEFTYQIA